MEKLEQLKTQLLEKIEQLDRRIAVKNGPTYFDETASIEKLHSEANAYEKVVAMINILQLDNETEETV